MKNKILLTGGLGYIGSHTAVVLLEAGYKVFVVDNLSNSELFVKDKIEKIANKTIEYVNADVSNFDSITNIFKENAFAGIIHFAAHKAVGESVEKPLMYYRNNLNGIINLLECMKQYKVDNFIFSSSCAVHGQADELPINENTPFKKAESPYAKTKQFGEEILEDFIAAHPKNGIILRYFNPVGAHPTGEIGELPKGIPNNLVPYVTQTAAGIRNELSVFGDDYPTRDGTCIRDYIYVMDLAKAHLNALERLINQKNDKALEVYSLGTETGSTVLEVVKAFEEANNIKLNYKIAPRRKGDIVSAFADSNLANKNLRWKATTNLTDAMKTAWNWQQKLNESS